LQFAASKKRIFAMYINTYFYRFIVLFRLINLFFVIINILDFEVFYLSIIKIY